jgi:hypothetical protein
MMPIHSEIISIQAQRGKIAVWAIVDSKETETAERNFCLIESGQEMPERMLQFLATVQLDDGEYVLHVFEE